MQRLATYRLQLNAECSFDEAASLVPYLAELGVSHLYCSPYLQAAPGSAHGYDVADPTRVNEELGGAAAHRRLVEALESHGLAQLLDIVPNHMAVVPENPWWWDVLAHGPGSRYARYFDVDWAQENAERQNVVLLPVLGDHYGRELEAGKIRIERDGERLRVRYHEQIFPLAPGSLDALLEETGVEALSTAALDAAIARVNADPDALDAVLERQHYRLAFWRMASRELGYRRFFDINALIALHAERAEVFRDVHARVLEWLDAGVLDGVRIDHIDGLLDPLQYLTRLRDACARAWILVEKIVEPGEELPAEWPIAGTTGYEFIFYAGGLFVDPSGEAPLTALYEELLGAPADYEEIVRSCKRTALRDLFGSDVNRLTALLEEICAAERRYRDYTRGELRAAIEQTIACFPVYRSYVRRGEVPSARDEGYVEQAIARAKEVSPETDPVLLDFLRDVLLLRRPGGLETELALRFQQLSGPAMAKGVEDTVFYLYHRLTALNEVGGAPDRFGVTPRKFHAWAAEVERRWPKMLLATSTHDTKRSEDVRTRITLLSEIPDRWAEAVRRWTAMNERHRESEWPDRNFEYLLYQTLVGAWPLDAERALTYARKAAKEAKAFTTWTRPNEAYEQALERFVAAVLDDSEFVAELERFVAPLVGPARVASLALTLLKVTAPGVPDFYRGTELWDLSLVDPDNRRPVDYATRRRLLGELDGLSAASVLERSDEGLPKLLVIREALRLRRERPAAFGSDGAYRPLYATGARSEHVVAFARGSDVVTVVPRWLVRLDGDWADTALELPAGRWRNVLAGTELDGGTVEAAHLFAAFPVALLAR